MTLFLSVILLRLVLKDDYLVTLAGFNNVCFYSKSVKIRSSDFDIRTFSCGEDFVKYYSATLI